MLPARKSDGPSLADVLQSCLSALHAEPNRLSLPPVDSAVVVLVDGLGADHLRTRLGHARTMASVFTSKSVIESGFPSTTAVALASLTTGALPGQHGMVGYSVLDPAHDRVVNQLSGWDDRLDPESWQLNPTLFERAAELMLDPVVIAPQRYRDSGLTRAVLRGARFVSAASIEDRMRAAAEQLRAAGSRLIYLYIPELDAAAHARGIDSPEWITLLESVDAALRELVGVLRPRQGLLLTADHGVVDIPSHSHVLVDGPLLDGVRFIAGEPRCLQLHLDPGTDPDLVAERWRAAEGARAWIATRAEAIEAGWFGEVRPEVLPRIGEVLVAARKNVAYYDGRVKAQSSRSMIGQHGSWSAAELRVPLLRFGAFAT